MTIFEQIMDSVDIKQAFEFYGIPVKRNMALCPFHGDKRPSLGFKKNRYRCYACGESGSVVDFVVKHFGITTVEAIKKINADFGLGIEMGKPNAAAQRKHDRQKKLVKAFEEWEKRAFIVYADELKLLEWVRDSVTPLWFEKKGLADYYAQCLQQLPRIDYIVTVLMSGEFKDKLQVYMYCRGEVEKLERKHESSGIK